MPAGRPRGFEVDAAVEAALVVFWSRGYAASTLDDLTDAIGVHRGSLYATFGNKEALFRRTVARYSETVGRYLVRALDQPTTHEVITAVWRGAVEATTGAGTPAGCLIVQSALTCSADDHAVHDYLSQIRRDDQALLQRRFANAADLPAHIDPASLASYVTAVQHGIAVQARSGVSRADLHAMIDLALGTLFRTTALRP